MIIYDHIFYELQISNELRETKSTDGNGQLTSSAPCVLPGACRLGGAKDRFRRQERRPTSCRKKLPQAVIFRKGKRIRSESRLLLCVLPLLRLSLGLLNLV